MLCLSSLRHIFKLLDNNDLPLTMLPFVIFLWVKCPIFIIPIYRFFLSKTAFWARHPEYCCNGNSEGLLYCFCLKLNLILFLFKSVTEIPLACVRTVLSGCLFCRLYHTILQDYCVILNIFFLICNYEQTFCSRGTVLISATTSYQLLLS